MSHELVICFIAIAANLTGMLVLYAALSHALARMVCQRRGLFLAIALIVISQLFWMAPALLILGLNSPAQNAAYILWMANWMVSAFVVIMIQRSTALIPTGLADGAKLDGLSGLVGWRHVVFPFVRRDLILIAALTMMATLVPAWAVLNQPGAISITLFEPATVFGMAPTLVVHVGIMIVVSLIGAVPLIGILFAAKRQQ